MKYYEDPILGKGRAADISGGTASADYIGGYRITIAGQTISNDRYMPIETVTGNSVTMQAGHAYKITATTSAVTLNTETIPANSFGLEGHLEIFVAGTGYVVTGTNVVLAQPLEPDSVNNCTVRFHDGLAIISVEDHVAGYIVISATGTADGSLPYGLATASQEYIAFDATTNGTPLDMGGAVTNGEKHVVGNGYSDTILTGSVSCTSKTTFANLAMSGAAVTGGTMTLGDVYIPHGATVSVSGGGLAINKVSGNGGTINLGGTRIEVQTGKATANGVTITNGSSTNGGALVVAAGATADFSSVSFVGNTVPGIAGAVFCDGVANFNSCIISGNNAASAKDVYVRVGTVTYNGCKIGQTKLNANGKAIIAGSCSLDEIANYNTTGSGTVTISSGAILDLTGNMNSTPINPGGGITFEAGGATVYPSAGSASAYTIADAVVTSIDNAGGVTLGAGQERNEVYTNVNISALPLGSLTVKHVGSGTFSDCRLQGIYNNRAILILGGTMSISKPDTVLFTNSGGLTKIEPNAVLDVHLGRPSSWLGNYTMDGTMEVMNGGTATIIYSSGGGTASKAITGSGTYIGNGGETDFTEVE